MRARNGPPAWRAREPNEQEDEKMMDLIRCKLCGAPNRATGRMCTHCGSAISRELPVFWFTFMACLFVMYTTLDFLNLV